MERGRSDYLRLLGVHHRELAAEGLAFAVARMAIDFLRPAAIDDLVLIRTAPRGATAARIVLQQDVLCEERKLVTATVTVALIGAAGRVVRLPAAIRAAFAATSRS